MYGLPHGLTCGMAWACMTAALTTEWMGNTKKNCLLGNLMWLVAFVIEIASIKACHCGKTQTCLDPAISNFAQFLTALFFLQRTHRFFIDKNNGVSSIYGFVIIQDLTVWRQIVEVKRLWRKTYEIFIMPKLKVKEVLVAHIVFERTCPQGHTERQWGGWQIWSSYMLKMRRNNLVVLCSTINLWTDF